MDVFELTRALIDVTLFAHMDTVPPFSPSREDGDFVWGRAR